jgi:hypothetical protein
MQGPPTIQLIIARIDQQTFSNSYYLSNIVSRSKFKTNAGINVRKFSKQTNKNLAVRGSVRLNDPSSLVAQCLQDLVVVTVLGKVVVAVHPKPRVYLCRDRSPPALPSPVVLPLPPRRNTGP